MEIKPKLTAEMWIEQPEVAAHIMGTASQEAADYSSAGLWAVGSMFLWFIINRVVKHGAGPFSGIVDILLQTFKTAEVTEKKDGDQS